MKFKTVREGEQAVLYNYLGEGTLLHGPTRVFIYRDKLERLKRYTASQYEYMEVKDIAGRVTHVPGPVEMFLNPLKMTSLTVREAIRIGSHSVIVVYKNTGNEVIRRIVEGPTVFIPAEDEWIHTFEWHGQDKDENDHMIRAARRIQQLPLIPEHFSDRINEVRTVDDTKMVIKLMVYYELKDVIKLLEETSDPIADMMNAMCSDVIKFVGRLTFKDFVEESDKLNKTETFEQLVQICDKIGFKLNKVVYRGYTVSLKLQNLHDRNIENRTKMRLQQDTQAMEQKLKDFKISREQNRMAQKNEIADLRQQSQQERTTLESEHCSEIGKMRAELDLKLQQLNSNNEIETKQADDELEESYMRQLKQLGVDLMQYLKTEQPQASSELIMLTQ